MTMLLAAAVPTVPVPPAPAPMMDYAFACDLHSAKDRHGRLLARFGSRNLHVADVVLRGEGGDLPGLHAAMTASVTEGPNFWIKDRQGDLDYTWNFAVSFGAGKGHGRVQLWAARMTDRFSSTPVGYVAVGICDVTASGTNIQ